MGKGDKIMIRENCRRSRILAHRGDMESGPEIHARLSMGLWKRVLME